MISIDTAQEVDAEGFAGRLLVGGIEAYRTVSVYPTSADALQAAATLLAGALGPRLAGQEWRLANNELHHAPLRTDLEGRANVAARGNPPEMPSH